MTAARLGIVTSGSVGWNTVRKRWENDLSDFTPTTFHIEDYRKGITQFTERFGAKSIGHPFAGRSAVKAAIDSGANIILLTTLQNAPLVPLDARVSYLIYGDCTTTQLAALYGGKRLRFPGSWISKRLQTIANRENLLSLHVGMVPQRTSCGIQYPTGSPCGVTVLR